MKVGFKYKGHKIALENDSDVVRMYIDDKLCDSKNNVSDMQSERIALNGVLKDDLSANVRINFRTDIFSLLNELKDMDRKGDLL